MCIDAITLIVTPDLSFSVGMRHRVGVVIEIVSLTFEPVQAPYIREDTLLIPAAKSPEDVVVLFEDALNLPFDTWGFGPDPTRFGM